MLMKKFMSKKRKNKNSSSKKSKENIKEQKIKDYLYLNMDFLETFISQIDGGYNALQISDDTRASANIQGSKTSTRESSIGVKLNEILSYLIKFDGYLKASTQSAPTYNIDTQLSKNVIYMKQRENILDRFIEYFGFNEDKAVNTLNRDYLGEYVMLRKHFDYINFSRLKTLAGVDMYDFYKEQSGQNSVPLDYIYKIRVKLPLLRKLFPFDTFLYADGVIVLMNDEYLRDNKEQIGYKFNSDVIVIGIVNKLASKPKKDSVSVSVTMDKIQIATLSLLRELGFIHDNDKEIFFVTPIAIYV